MCDCDTKPEATEEAPVVEEKKEETAPVAE